MVFSGSDRCNKDIKILPVFIKYLYFPPYSTQILCTIMFIVLPIYSPHLRFSPVFIQYLPGKILTWINPNLCHLHIYSSVAEYVWRKTIILSGLTLTSWSLFQLGPPCSFLAFPNPSIPILLPNSCVLSPETCNSPLPHSLIVNDFAPDFTEKLNGLLKLPPHLPKPT